MPMRPFAALRAAPLRRPRLRRARQHGDDRQGGGAGQGGPLAEGAGEAAGDEADRSEGSEGPGNRPAKLGLIIEDTKVGDGKVASAGDSCYMLYRGTLKDGGKEFDSSPSITTILSPSP